MTTVNTLGGNQISGSSSSSTTTNTTTNPPGKAIVPTPPNLNTNAIAAPTLPNQTLGQYAPYQQQMQDAYYQQGASRLDPRMEQEQGRLETQLQNMGLTRGSAAWNTEMANQMRSRNDAYGSLQRDAILNSGAEAQRMQGMDLTSANFNNNAAQQGFENNMTAQGFSNQQLRDQFGMNMDSQQLQAQIDQWAQQNGISREQIANAFAMQGMQSGTQMDIARMNDDARSREFEYGVERNAPLDNLTLAQGWYGMMGNPGNPQFSGTGVPNPLTGNQYNAGLATNTQGQVNNSLGGNALQAFLNWYGRQG